MFVLGHARSGTTLLAAMLNAHPRIRMAREPHLVRSLRIAGIDYRGMHGADRRRRVLDVMARHQRAGLPVADVERFRDSPEPFTFRQAYESLLPVTGEPDVIWGEKSPENLLYLTELLALYPDAFFVHILRDPRAVVLSKYRKKFHAKARVLPDMTLDSMVYVMATAMRWRAVVAYGHAVLSGRPASDWCEIRFEDLVADPESQLNRVCHRVGLAFDTRMLDHNRREGSRSSRQLPNLVTEPLSKDRKDAWRELPDWATWLVERQCGALMGCLGYAWASPSLSWWKRTLCSMAYQCWRRRLRLSLWARVSAIGADSALQPFV